MNVIYIHGEDEQYANFVLDDSVLTIDGLQYNLVSLQKDEQSIINVIEDDMFIANIIIPPAKYEEIETSELDDEERPIYKKIKNPLDLESVTLNLWKKEIKIKNESEKI